MATLSKPLAGPAKRRSVWLRRWKKRETWLFYICISPPWLLGFLIWTAGPMVYSLYLSLTSWDLFTAPQWVGLGNYQDLLTDNPDFWQSLKVTATYTFVSVPLSLIIALALALLLNSKVRGIAFFRTIFYLPSVLPAIAVAVLWVWVFNPSYGILNIMLALVGIEGPKWLGDPNWALPALILMSFWSPGCEHDHLPGRPSGNLRDALRGSRTGRGQQSPALFNMTIPQLTPTIFFNLVMSIIGSFQVFTQAYAMTEGGPRKATLFYMYYLFDMAFIKFRMGYASALAWILFIIILVFTLLVIRSSNLWVYYESETK